MSCPCGCGQEWPRDEETINCPHCGHAAPIADMMYRPLRERIEQLPRRPSGIGSRVEWVLLDDVLALLNSQQEK